MKKNLEDHKNANIANFVSDGKTPICSTVQCSVIFVALRRDRNATCNELRYVTLCYVRLL